MDKPYEDHEYGTSWPWNIQGVLRIDDGIDNSIELGLLTISDLYLLEWMAGTGLPLR